ncbi:MAG TPA: class A beta-lactamase, partial [Coprobacter fastidiosus]|nr:class A beta-lactamase [Coprobacter fastidiosus]
MKYFIVGVLIACFTVTVASSKDERELKMRIASVLKEKRAIVGVAVLYGDNRLFEVNRGDYPMMSVCKFPLALAVLDYLHKNNLSLDTDIFIRESDLLPDTYSPLRDRHPQGNIKMSIRELLSYTVSLSDNNACDILFGYIGGTKVVDDYIKRLGISGMSVVATEAVMHESFEKQYCNTATPSSAVLLLDKFLKEDLLRDEYGNYLRKIMIETSTGNDKIKAGLPEG